LGWTAGFVIGLIVILVYSRDQLNRPVAGDEVALRRARLLQMVAPDQLRSRSVFFRGYLFYAGSLSLIFTVLSLGGASAIQLFMAGAGAGDLAEMAPGASLDGATAPLAVALVLVGLLPSSPLLRRFEERIRDLAHRMVGVPATFHSFTEALLRIEVDRAAIDGPMVGEEQAARLHDMLDAARRVFGDGPMLRRFRRALVKVFAFHAWETGLQVWPNYSVRNEFKRIEHDIAPNVGAVLADMRQLVATPAPPPGAGEEALARSETESRWKVMLERVSNAEEDVCALFALYAERASTRPHRTNPVTKVLCDLIEQADASRRGLNPQVDAWVMSLLVLSIIMFFVGYAGEASGISPTGASSPAHAGLMWALGVLFMYGPASLVSWSARRPTNARIGWRNAFADPDMFPVLQYAGVFASAWVISTLSVATFFLGTQMIFHVAEVGPDNPLSLQSVFDAFLARRPGAPLGLAWQAPLYGLLGGAHAVMLGLLQDYVSSTRGKPRGGPGMVKLSVGHGAVLAVLIYLVAGSTGQLSQARTIDRLEGRAAMAADAILVNTGLRAPDAGDAPAAAARCDQAVTAAATLAASREQAAAQRAAAAQAALDAVTAQIADVKLMARTVAKGFFPGEAPPETEAAPTATQTLVERRSRDLAAAKADRRRIEAVAALGADGLPGVGDDAAVLYAMRAAEACARLSADGGGATDARAASLAASAVAATWIAEDWTALDDAARELSAIDAGLREPAAVEMLSERAWRVREGLERAPWPVAWGIYYQMFSAALFGLLTAVFSGYAFTRARNALRRARVGRWKAMAAARAALD